MFKKIIFLIVVLCFYSCNNINTDKDSIEKVILSTKAPDKIVDANEENLYNLINDILWDNSFITKRNMALYKIEDLDFVKRYIEISIDDEKYPVLEVSWGSESEVFKEYPDSDRLLFSIEKEFQVLLKMNIKDDEIDVILNNYSKIDSVINLKKDFLKINKVVDDSMYSKIMNSTNLNLDKKWEEVYEKFGKANFSFSIPIFNLNKNLAIISVSCRCGSLCAFTGTYVYIKNKDKWERVGVIGGEVVS